MTLFRYKPPSSSKGILVQKYQSALEQDDLHNKAGTKSTPTPTSSLPGHVLLRFSADQILATNRSQPQVYVFQLTTLVKILKV